MSEPRGLLTQCARCGPRPEGTRHYGRGLCGRCGSWLQRNAPQELTSYPRRTRPQSELATRALRIRAERGEPGWSGWEPRAGRRPDTGVTWAEIAVILGVSRDAVMRAVQRHRARERARA